MIEARPSALRPNVGYVLAQVHRGRGRDRMSEGVRALSDAALSSIYFPVEATCDIDDHASASVPDKYGFVREARLTRSMVVPSLSPESRDSWMYAVHE